MRHQNLRRILHHEWPHVVFAARGTFAALAALAIAFFLKLECPYWAAMTALIVIQPTRGLLLEKSFYRLVGTAIGSVAGMMMLLVTMSPVTLTMLLSLWLAGCVGIGNLLYGLRSYSAMVAGLTGAVIAMAGHNTPPQLHDLIFSRIACIIIGIVVSTTVTLFFSRRHSKRELLDRLSSVAVAEIEWISLLIRGVPVKELFERQHTIFVEIAAIEETMDSAWAGSIDLKRRQRRVRSLIVSLLSLLEAGKLAGDYLNRRGFADASWREPLARHVENVARHLDKAGSTSTGLAGLEQVVAEAGEHLPVLGETLAEMVTALHNVIYEWDTTIQTTERPASTPFIRHRDWKEAGRAGLRAAVAISAVGFTWYFTGWKEGPLMLLAASIMVSIFSTHDRPATMLTHIFFGASVGVAAAFLCRLVILPGVSSPILQMAISIPVLMASSIARYHRRTSLGAMDAMLFFLFVMQPGLPAAPDPPAFVAGGLAALGGIVVAILVFRFLLPIDPARRLRSLLCAIARDLALMAATESLPVVEKCRARTHHRVLRMLATATKLDRDRNTIVEGGLAALAIARFLQRLKESETNRGISLVPSDTMRDISFRLSAAIQRPGEILSGLGYVSNSLCMAMGRYHEVVGTSVPAALPAMSDELLFPSGMMFAGRQESPCHI